MTLRIACGGIAVAKGGSVASAGFEVLRELLARGYEIDFFSKRDYVYPEALMSDARFRYVDCSQTPVDRAVLRAPTSYGKWVAGTIGNALTARRILRKMRREHVLRRYDLELFLGQWAFGRLPDRPVVSWVQGPPGTDARSVSAQRERIRALCGRHEQYRLRAFAAWRQTVGLPPFKHSDLVICGSAWARRELVSHYGFREDRIRCAPYPIDLAWFTPGPDFDLAKPQDVVWVGRVVPRKRLDLFLDAGAMLIAEGRDIKLTVMGSFPFAKGFSKLFDEFPYPDRLRYVQHASAGEVRDLLRGAAVLLQPSQDENFGSAVAEALACGAPVVLGPSNGTGEYVREAVERFESYDAASVAAATARILDRDPGSVMTLRANAAKVANREFTVGRVVDDLERIFQEARAA